MDSNLTFKRINELYEYSEPEEIKYSYKANKK